MDEKYFLGILDKVEDALWEDPTFSEEDMNKIVRILHNIDNSEQIRITREIREK